MTKAFSNLSFIGNGDCDQVDVVDMRFLEEYKRSREPVFIDYIL